MVGDFNRIVFQNILKGDFPGALNAVGDALNPFSDSLELRYDGPAVGLLRWSSFGGLKGRRAANKFSQVREAGKRPERGGGKDSSKMHTEGRIDLEWAIRNATSALGRPCRHQKG